MIHKILRAVDWREGDLHAFSLAPHWPSWIYARRIARRYKGLGIWRIYFHTAFQEITLDVRSLSNVPEIALALIRAHADGWLRGNEYGAKTMRHSCMLSQYCPRCDKLSTQEDTL